LTVENFLSEDGDKQNSQLMPDPSAVTREQKISVIFTREKLFATLAPALNFVLGVAHGVGANLPKLAWLQALALIAALTVCFHFARERRAAIHVMAALSFSLASALTAHDWLATALMSEEALGLALGCCVFAALMMGLALLPAVAMILASALVTQDSSRRLGMFALALTYPLAEMTTAEVVGFASHSLGYAWIETPLAVLLPTIGVYGVSAAVALTCSWFAVALGAAYREGFGFASFPWRGVAVLSCVVIALAVVQWSNHRGDAAAVSTELRARLVQTDQPLHQKFDVRRVHELVDELIRLTADSDAQLIVAPETAIPVAWIQLPEKLRLPLERIASDPQRLFLLGMFDFRDDGGQLNVAAALRHDVGSRPPPRYAKRRLMPIAEYSPPGLAWIADLLALEYDDRVTDDAPETAFEVGGTRLKNTICLDLSYPGEMAATAAITGVIVNQSNFVAFPGPRVRAQFLSIARARALEQRKPVLIASNAGPTTAIAADGRILASLPATGARVLDVSVQPGSGSSLYATFGELLWIAALLLGLALTTLLGARAKT
jgi:apolipoprotein N-acyltransferase